nr:GNAT family N-acetyltransferase [uncultured Psychroserpens sp.]
MALLFIETVFNEEQHIPKELIPLTSTTQKWWCIRTNNEVLGIVAAWTQNGEWHWGRLAIHKKLRGLGFGKKIALFSLEEIFKTSAEHVIIDARDITVNMVLKMGGEITGLKTDFYGHPITPMKIDKLNFLKSYF